MPALFLDILQQAKRRSHDFADVIVSPLGDALAGEALQFRAQVHVGRHRSPMSKIDINLRHDWRIRQAAGHYRSQRVTACSAAWVARASISASEIVLSGWSMMT